MSLFLPIIAALLLGYVGVLAALAYLKKNPALLNLAPVGGALLVAAATLLRYKLYLTRPVLATTLISLWALERLVRWYRKPVVVVQPPPVSATPEQPVSPTPNPVTLPSLATALALQVPLTFALATPTYLLNRMC